MLGPDSRDSIDTGVIDDPRVRHFWDESRVVGLWLAETGVGSSGSSIVWDAYYVFGPKASWNERPAPITAFGTPVISNTAALGDALMPLLR